MCGLAGIFGKNIKHKLLVSQMLSSMKHRGPDGLGVYACDRVVIGMVRLSIRGEASLELPFCISTPSGSKVYGALNGQIYSVKGGADEIGFLLNESYLIDGMYAVTIYDETQPNKLILKRDSFGIKPLYYKTSAVVSFGSEIPSLLKCAPGENVLNTLAIQEVLLWGAVLGNKTIYRELKKVLPGETILLQVNNAANDSFINISSKKKSHHENTFAVKDLREAIQNSVLSCLDSNHPVGLAISGGLDSTILAYELNALHIENLTTISLKIEDSEDGITDLAELNFPKGGSWQTWKHHTITFAAKEFPLFLGEATALFGQPQRMTSFPMYLKLADLATSTGIKVLLSGEGADELFFGYKSYADWFMSKDSKTSVGSQLLEFMLPVKFKSWFDALIGADALDKLERNLLHHVEPLNQLSPIKALMQLEKEISLEPLLLRTDICLMSRSIEGRVPFLHGGVQRYTEAFPDDVIFNGGILKPILREAYRDCFSSYDVPKRPFRAPIHKWFTRQLKGWVFQTLNDGIENLIDLGFKETGLKRFISVLGHDDFEIRVRE